MRRVCFVLAAAALLAGVLGPVGAEARTSCRNTGSFEGWKDGFRDVAARSGVSERTLRRAYDPIRFDRKVIGRDRGQKFFARSFIDFSKKLVSKGRIGAGKRMLKKRAALFAAAERRFGVPGPVIAAFWALESDFGAGINPKNQHLIFNALGTLAYDCRRPELFREQLIAALKLVDKGMISYDRMVGSWAGEIGETQFLPAHVLNHAVDADGDGRIDLYRSDADIIFSSANFIKHLGWRAGEPWLEEVRVPNSMRWEEADLAILHPRSTWAGWGVKRRDGSALPAGGPPAALLLPMGRNGPAFLAYRNFRIYPEWNNSLNYATTAAYLATRLKGAPAYRSGGGYDAFTSDQIKQLQRRLIARGHDTGGADGMLGVKSRAAVKKEQLRLGLPADSYPTRELARRLR